MLDERSGQVTLRCQGTGSRQLFENEPGGHRWQRVPPTERRGRVQTSTVTVAVLNEPDRFDAFSLNDVELVTERGHGKGGQHRNKTESAVHVKHRPTGIEAYCQSERSQHQNKAAALAVLRARVFEYEQRRIVGDRAQDRRQQVGSGQRGDKRRTVRQRDGQVNDHVTGRRWRYEDYVQGQW